MTKYIYVSWIHWVWKSHFCWELSNKLNIVNISASKKIFENSDNTDINEKITQNIDTNISYLLKWLSSLSDDLYILDAHFVLINKDGNFVIIPDYFFDNLKIEKIILLLWKINIIKENLKKRDNKNFSDKFISDFQDLEKKQAIYISQKYNIELEIMSF